MALYTNVSKRMLSLPGSAWLPRKMHTATKEWIHAGIHLLHLGGEQQCGLSVLLKDKGAQYY